MFAKLDFVMIGKELVVSTRICIGETMTNSGSRLNILIMLSPPNLPALMDKAMTMILPVDLLTYTKTFTNHMTVISPMS